jgi:glycosyltransferase involved in cell wall biosynthesis
VVFISRISPMKNLLVAIESLMHSTGRVVMSIYGPIEDKAYWARCQAAIERLPSNVEAIYKGALGRDRVRQKFAENDLFLFPTLGENFGHVIAESLSASCPVVCSDRTPWGTVLAAGGGIVIHDPTPEAFGLAVQKIADMRRDERHAMRERAREAYRTWRRQSKDENILDRVSRR